MKLSQLAREIPEVADWQRRLAELLATTHAHPDGQTRREILAVHIPRLYVSLSRGTRARLPFFVLVTFFCSLNLTSTESFPCLLDGENSSPWKTLA
jgi:hypothetical protein